MHPRLAANPDLLNALGWPHSFLSVRPMALDGVVARNLEQPGRSRKYNGRTVNPPQPLATASGIAQGGRM